MTSRLVPLRGDALLNGVPDRFPAVVGFPDHDKGFSGLVFTFKATAIVEEGVLSVGHPRQGRVLGAVLEGSGEDLPQRLSIGGEIALPLLFCDGGLKVLGRFCPAGVDLIGVEQLNPFQGDVGRRELLCLKPGRCA